MTIKENYLVSEIKKTASTLNNLIAQAAAERIPIEIDVYSAPVNSGMAYYLSLCPRNSYSEC